MRVLRTFFGPLMLGVLALMLCSAWRANNGRSLKLDTDIHWDLASAEKQLQEQVHGQESAIQQLMDSLKWTQQEADQLNPTNHNYTKVIFLLGGPGVGKTEAVKIISENLMCHFRGIWAMIPCATNLITRLSVTEMFISQVFVDYPKYLRYHGAALNMLELELAEFNDEQAKKFKSFELRLSAFEDRLPRSALFVSGSVMTIGQLKSLTPNQYNQLLDRYALQIAKAMASQAESVEIAIIKFDKLKPHDMMKYMRRNSSDNEQNLHEIHEIWESHLNSSIDDQMWKRVRSSTEPVDYVSIIHSYFLYFYQPLLALLISLLVGSM